MFGSVFFVFDAGFALFPLLLFLLGVLDWRRKRNTGSLVSLILFTLISVLWVPVLTSQLYHKTTNYFFLSTLQVNQVSSISVGETRWQEPTDIQRIVTAVNSSVWHVTNHDIGGPFEIMTITLRSGQTKVFRVGWHDNEDDALIEFFRPYSDSNGFWADGDTFVPGLPNILEDLGHSLPIRSQYPSQPLRHYLLGFINRLQSTCAVRRLTTTSMPTCYQSDLQPDFANKVICKCSSIC